jgi:hypothetical protein
MQAGSGSGEGDTMLVDGGRAVAIPDLGSSRIDWTCDRQTHG